MHLGKGKYLNIYFQNNGKFIEQMNDRSIGENYETMNLEGGQEPVTKVWPVTTQFNVAEV